jgi:hypothetical protein
VLPAWQNQAPQAAENDPPSGRLLPRVADPRPIGVTDLAVWGTVQEGRVLSVKVASKTPATTLGYRTDDSNDADITRMAAQHLVGLLNHKHDD